MEVEAALPDYGPAAELRGGLAVGGQRGLFALQAISEGQLVHESALLLAGPLDGHAKRLCAACFKASDEDLRHSCPECKQAFFCSQECAEWAERGVDGSKRARVAESSSAEASAERRRDCRQGPSGLWAHSGQVCSALRLWPRMLQGLPGDQVGLLRALLPLYAGADGGGGVGAGAEGVEPAVGAVAAAANARAAFRRLHWHPEAWAGRERESWGPALTRFLRLLAEAEIPRPPTLEDLEGDIGRLECNGFTLSAPDRNVVGLGIYPSAAIGFNHDCSPNCRADAAGSNTALRVLAARDIPAGEELRISYVDVSEPGPIRRRDLRQQYHFECGCGRCLVDLSLGETGRVERGRRDRVDADMAPAEMLDASKAWEVMDRLAGRADCNAVVLSPLPELRKGSCARLRQWASRLCALGELVEDTLYYWEGYKAEPSEPVRAQFCRQIRDDFEEMAAAVAEDAADGEAAAGIGDPEALASLEGLVTWLMDLYESGSGGGAGCGSESRGFALKLDVNGKDSVAKFHDDWFTVRFEVALAGGGTVLAQNSSVDWQFWDECRGRMAMTEGSADEVERQIRAWNAKVCPPSGELALDAMSLCAMKGGGITNRPCVHRAPYEAVAGPRFLISLDKMTRAEMEKQRDMMDFDASEGGSSESEGGS